MCHVGKKLVLNTNHGISQWNINANLRWTVYWADWDVNISSLGKS